MSGEHREAEEYAAAASELERAANPAAPPLFPSPTEAHLRTAIQALAYLLAFNEVTKQPSVFDAEREAALVSIREHIKTIAAAADMARFVTSLEGHLQRGAPGLEGHELRAELKALVARVST